MNVLIVHNRYREPGGEDRVVELESALLAGRGHKVVQYIEDNARVAGIAALALAARTIWSRESYRTVRNLIAKEQIDLVHVHNTLPLVSPSVLHAADACGVPVVQTLHNYRPICPNGVCYRGENRCVECIDRGNTLPAVRHACYRGSVPATAAVAAMVWTHRTARTWDTTVDAYIAPSEFARTVFARGGFPADRIAVKPHCVDPDPGLAAGAGGYAIYVGRLSREKGVEVLLDAWSRLRPRIPLVIIGDGPLAPAVAAAAAERSDIRWHGRLPRAEAQGLIGDASFLVFPSVVFETFGQVIGEAYAAGTPVIATSGGAGAELVAHRRTGMLAQPGDARDLAAQVEWLLACPELHTSMRAAARAVYESRLTAEANYQQLMNIYRRAADHRRPLGMTA